MKINKLPFYVLSDGAARSLSMDYAWVREPKEASNLRKIRTRQLFAHADHLVIRKRSLHAQAWVLLVVDYHESKKKLSTVQFSPMVIPLDLRPAPERKF